jgi:perosamine synthetase
MYSDFVAFIRKTFNTETAFLPLHEPRFVGNEKKYVIDAIDSTYVSSVGQYVNTFEKMMCDITGAKYAIACVNGTNALHLALILAGVKKDEEVLTQSLTFVATCNAISYINAIPHFVDVDLETMGLSPSLLKKYLQQIAEIKNGQCYNKNTGKRIAACVPMHTFGLPVYIDELVAVCNEYNIPLVEDAAESIGSYYNNQHTGTFGLVGVFSFNGNKIVTSGGGGCVITNNESIAKLAKHLSTQAKVPHRWDFEHDEIGFNYRMPNLNAALMCAQLEQLDNFVENKRALSKMYQTYFALNNFAKYVTEIPNATSNYWLNAILFDTALEKNNFLTYTNDHQIMTRPIWKLMNELKHFSNCPKADLSNAKYLEERVVNITSSVRV